MTTTAIQAKLDRAANRGRWLALAAAMLGWMFDGVEMGLFPLVARPALKELIGPSASEHMGTWLSAIIATFLLGAAAGGVIFGWLGDRIGRVRAMVWAVVTYSIFSGLCCLSVAPWHLATLRFLASLGMGGEWSLGVALVMEVWSGGSRPLMAGLIGAAANVGYLGIAIVGLSLSKIAGHVGAALAVVLPQPWVNALLANGYWRLLLLLGALPAMLAVLIQLFVPESKRWQEASAHSPKNKLGDIFKDGMARTTIFSTLLGAIALLGTWGSVQWIPSWADKLSGGLPEAKSLAQMCTAGGAIVGTIFAALLAQATSRRLAYFALSLLSLLSCAYLFRAHLPYGPAFLTMAFVVGGLTASFFGWLPLYLPELFPTRVRATGQGFAFNMGRVLAAGGTLVSGQLLNYFHEDYGQMCSWISLIYVAGLVAIWFCPETKGKPLPE